MIKHPAWLGAALIAGALTLAACGSGPSTSATASTLSSTAASATAGSNASSDFCTAIKQSRANFVSIGSTLAKSMQAGKFASAQQTLQAFFQTAEAEIARVESTMTTAPANVQAALTTINKFYAQIGSVVAHATSMTMLATSMVALGKDTQVQLASATLKAYELSQCGNLGTPSP